MSTAKGPAAPSGRICEKEIFFKCMYVLCSSSMMNANVTIENVNSGEQ